MDHSARSRQMNSTPTTPSMVPPPGQARESRREATRPAAPAGTSWTVVTGNGFRETALAVLAELAIAMPILAAGGWSVYTIESEKAAARQAWRDRVESLDRVLAGPAGTVLPIDEAA